MKRLDFLKSAGLVFTGVSMGIINPLSAKTKEESFRINQEDFDLPLIVDKRVEESSPIFWAWLARLATSALVTSLVAKVVDNMVPPCEGEKCPIKRGEYSNSRGIYGYDNVTQRFYKQDVQDNSINFQNVSVPFINYIASDCGSDYQEVVKVEGPYLAGLCFLTQDLLKKYPAKSVRNAIVPRKKIKNGGYSFKNSDCNGNSTTEFKTKYGKTQLTYNPQKQTIGTRIYDEYDNLNFNQAYLVNT